MRLLTQQQATLLDRLSMDHGISGEILMGKAGECQIHTATFHRLQRQYPEAVAQLSAAKRNILPGTLRSTILNLELAENQIDFAINIAVQTFMDSPQNKDSDLFDMSKKIINGYNKNEVKLVRKKTRNKAFFEKFFDFFS